MTESHPIWTTVILVSSGVGLATFLYFAVKFFVDAESDQKRGRRK